VRAGWLKKLLIDRSGRNPGPKMPRLLVGDPTALGQEPEALVHLLDLPAARGRTAGLEGDGLGPRPYNKVGCVAPATARAKAPAKRSRTKRAQSCRCQNSRRKYKISKHDAVPGAADHRTGIGRMQQ